MKKSLKKLLCIAVAFLIAVSSLSASALAAYSSDYPDGVSPAEAQNAVGSTDRLIASVCRSFTGSDLKALVLPMLYNSDTLSTALVSIYAGFGEKAADMQSLGIDVSPAGVAKGLGAYPAVSASLEGAADWSSVSLAGVDWGVNDRSGFVNALAASLSPLNDMLYMLLCSGSYRISIITINGGNGYENAIVPLLKALCCDNIMSQSDFSAAAAADKNTMIVNILEPVCDLLEKICNAPADTLTAVLPTVADYIKNGGFDAAMDAIMQPIKENRLVEIATFLRILDLDSFDLNMGDVLAGSLGDMSAQGSLKLPEIDFESFAACGESKDGVFVPDKGKAYIAIMRFLIDTLKLNADSLPALLAQGGSAGAAAQMPGDMLEKLTAADTDTLIKVMISLFEPGELPAPAAMVYPAHTRTQVQYTQNLTQENFVTVLGGLDGIIDEFVAEGGQYPDVATMLAVQIYTNENINSLMLGIYTELEKQGLTDALKLLNIDISPAGVAAVLTENGYAGVRNALAKASKWSDVSLNGVRWNFYSGQRTGFENALTASLRPLFPLLRFLLAGEDITLFDAVTLKGGDGYNTAVIPLLEALGCSSAEIKTYSQYQALAGTDGIVKEIVHPIFSLVDKVLLKPVDTLTAVLPNIAYFMSSGSLEKCIANLMRPLTPITEKLKPIYPLDFDTSSLTSQLDISKLTSSLTSSAGIKLQSFDIKSLASLGTLTEHTSKSVINGAPVRFSYVEADQTAVLITVLRFLVDTMKMPENKDALSGLMGSGATDAMAQYSSSMFDQFDTMTTDETIEFLYNLLFKERVKAEIAETEKYSPTIIYQKEKKEVKPLPIILGCLGGAWVLAWIVVLCNRKKFFDM